MYTLNKHVRWREENNRLLICDCKRLIDLKLDSKFKPIFEKFVKGINASELTGTPHKLFSDFKKLNLLSKLNFRAIKKSEFKTAMHLLDEELCPRVRTNSFLLDKFKKFPKLFTGAFIENELIGIICGFLRDDYVLISELAVDSRFRNRGFATHLVRIFEENAKKLGQKINVGARDEALPFYEKLNYSPFLLVQHNKPNYLISLPKQFKILREYKIKDHYFLEIKITKLWLKLLEQLRLKYPEASFQYIFTKKI